MGRSVDYLTNAEYVIYFSANYLNGYDENGEYDEFIAQFNWNDFMNNLKYEITKKLKSYYECERWDGRETKIFLENNHAEIGISEYCGLYSLSIRPKENLGYYSYEKDTFGIAKYHCKQIEKTLIKCLQNCGVELLNRIGTFSNGCGVFEKT